MAHIDDVPAGVTAAGQDHNFTGPALGGVVLVNAPVTPDMRVGSRGPAAAEAFIEAEIAANRAWVSNIAVKGLSDTLAIPLAFNSAMTYNYARITIGTRKWYLFVTDYRAAAIDTTVLTVEVDPLSSYSGWGLGYSMITRGHAPVAASQGDTYGNLYCTAPEPIDAPPALGVMSQTVLSSSINNWTVIVISANDLRGDGSSTPYFKRHVAEAHINNAADRFLQAGRSPDLFGDDAFWPSYDGPDSSDWPYHGYAQSDFGVGGPWEVGGKAYVPSVRASPVSTIDGVAQGGGAYLFTPAGYANWAGVLQGAPWVVEGITDIRLVPTWAVSGGGGGGPVGNRGPRSPEAAEWAAAAAIPNFVQDLTTNNFDQTVLTGWRDMYLASVGGQRFRKLVTGAHVKVVIGSGESMTEYDPELMQTSGVVLHGRTGLAHGEPSIRLTADYNQLTDQVATVAGAGGRAGMAAAGYGRGAANTASASLAPASAALTNYQTRQATEYNMVLARHTEAEKVAMNMGIIGIQSVVQAGGGAALAGFAGAGPAGAIVGAVVGGAGAAITGGVSSNNSLDLQDISVGGSLDIASYQLASNGYMAVLNFRTWVQGLEAISGRGQSAAVAAAWRLVSGQGFRVVIVAPAQDRVDQLLSTWKRFGYMVGRAFEPSRLDVMSKYSYWQTDGAVIKGRVPQRDRDRIAAAFDRGITLYESWNDIGADVSADNVPVSGFTY